MKIPFYKYQGTGNDFIIINNFFDEVVYVNSSFIKMIPKICERKWGVGSDGLILIEKSDVADFKMTFFNPDGSKSFCGNGARCAIKFASDIKIYTSLNVNFEAIDGIHQGTVLNNDLVELAMSDVSKLKPVFNGVFIDTGAPHYVEIIEDSIESFDIKDKAKPLRWNEFFQPIGTNVNFIKEIEKNKIAIRTFEKGVEDETLSCGTGITAGAIYYLSNNGDGEYKVNIIAKGGDLKVFASKKNNVFVDVKLIGKAIMVFKGKIDFE